MKNYFYLLILAIAFVSCNEDQTTYEPLSYPDDAFIALASDDLEILEDESNALEVIVEYSNSIEGSTFTATSNYMLVSDDAEEGIDYYIENDKSSFTFKPGTFKDIIKIFPIDNENKDGDKEITFSLVENNVPVGYAGTIKNKSKITITILDDDCSFSTEDLDNITWGGFDNAIDDEGPNATQITTTINESNNLLMNGLAFGWLTGNFWNEEVIASTPLNVLLDEETGDITINEQYLCDTSYLGSPQATYYIRATGKYYPCQQQMVINYTLIQDDSVLREYTEIVTY